MQGNNDIFGYNLYSYVSNSPIVYNDPVGKWKTSFFSDIIDTIKMAYNILKNPATKPIVNKVSSIVKDVAKTELQKAVRIEYSSGSGYGIGANFNGIGVEAKNITFKSTTTIKPFPNWQETYNTTSESAFKIAGTGLTKVENLNNNNRQFNFGNVDISNNTIFIGVEVEAYFKVSGSFKVGLEFDETNLFYYGYKAILKR